MESDKRIEEFERRLGLCASFQRIFNCADGELVLNELKAITGYSKPIHETDPVELGRRTGAHNLILYIDNMLNEDMKKWQDELKKQKG